MFCQKHSDHSFASGRSGSNPIYLDIYRNRWVDNRNIYIQLERFTNRLIERRIESMTCIEITNKSVKS